MAKFCFRCEKELGKFSLQVYPPKNLTFEGKTVPQDMTDNDIVCHDCYGSLSFTEKQKKYEKILDKVLVIDFVIITILASYWALVS